MPSKTKRLIASSTLPLTYFFLGVFSIISQTMLIREFLVVAYGNELILGILFFNWLTGIFLGALFGAKIADRSTNPLLVLVITILVMSLLLPFALGATRFLYALSGTPAGTYIGFIPVSLFSALLIIPLAFFIGLSFPMAARAQMRTKEKKGSKTKKIANLYIIEALGFLAGGLLYTFVLAGRVNPFAQVALAVLPPLITCSIMLLRSKHYVTQAMLLILLTLNFTFLIPGVNNRLDSFTVNKRWQHAAPLPLVYNLDSRYQNIAVSQLLDQNNLYLNTRFTAAFPDPEENRILAAHLYCQHPGPKEILVMGDALTGLGEYLLKYDIRRVVSLEFDPMVMHTILKFMPQAGMAIFKDPRFDLQIRDGRKYVRDMIRSNIKFDIIFLNLPEPSTLLLNRFYTRDFFLSLSGILNEGGVIAFRITSSENYASGLVSDYTATLYRTAASVFPEVVVAPGEHNFIFAGTQRGQVSLDPEVLAARYTASGAKPEKLAMIFYSLYPTEKTAFINQTLYHSPGHSINQDDRPIANFYYSKIMGWYAGGKLPEILEGLEGLTLTHLGFFFLALLILRIGYLFLPRSPRDRVKVLKSHTLLAVFTMGLVGISLELMIIYTFQNIFGYIYQVIGLIIAVFMLGLPLGALLSRGLLRKTRNKIKAQSRITRRLIFLHFLMIIPTLALAGVSHWLNGVSLHNQAIIFVITCLTGCAVGMVFPLAIHIYLGYKENIGEAAGFVDAYDHLGAAVGALLLGTLLLPLIGVVNVCILLVILQIFSSSLLLTDLRAHKKSESG